MFDAEAVHVLAKLGEQIVGTCRVLTASSAGESSDYRFATPGQAHYDYESLRRDRIPMVEVSRSSVLPEHRGSAVLGKLWKSAYACAKHRDATHFMSVVQVGCTDSLADARLVHALLARRDLLHPRYDLVPRTTENGPSAPCRPLFSDAERSGESEPRLPPVMRLFHRFGLRACAEPVFMRLHSALQSVGAEVSARLLSVLRSVRVVSGLVGFILGPIGSVFGLGGSLVGMRGGALARLRVGALGGLRMAASNEREGRE